MEASQTLNPETEAPRRGRPANPNRVLTRQEILKRALEAGEFDNSNPDPLVQKTIDETMRLFEEKAAILEKIQKRRVYGSMFLEDDMGSEWQRAWIQAYLPRKIQEGSEDESDSGTEDETNGEVSVTPEDVAA